jgi:hypothetical protein
MTTVRITINGTEQQHEVEDRTLLIHYIRENARLTGAHIGCDTSNCGACTVLLNGEAVKSCTLLAVQADGEHVTTVEGLSGRFNGLSAVQEGFRQEHGREGPAHEDFAVGEVDHLEDAIHQGVTESDEGVDAAQRQAGHAQVKPRLEGVLAGPQGGDRPDHHDDQDR